ncbi:MAG: TRAP transporter small permease [Gammaproteobacteria bacterium]|nr:TRAP transporter small permease [Gammaproteobacteria bacterium]
MAEAGASAVQRCRRLLVRVVGGLSTACGVVAALMILVSVLITCQMIWVRFVLNASTIWQTEAVTYLMIAATLIGLPYVQRLRGHVNVDLLPMLLPPAWRRWLTLLVLVASIVVIGIMAYHGFMLFHEAWDRNWRSDTVWGVSLWIPYLALPLGFGLFVLQLLADVVAALLCDDDALEHGVFEEDY